MAIEEANIGSSILTCSLEKSSALTEHLSWRSPLLLLGRCCCVQNKALLTCLFFNFEVLEITFTQWNDPSCSGLWLLRLDYCTLKLTYQLYVNSSNLRTLDLCNLYQEHQRLVWLFCTYMLVVVPIEDRTCEQSVHRSIYLGIYV